jgi:hypothetical protein
MEVFGGRALPSARGAEKMSFHQRVVDPNGGFTAGMRK